MNQNLPQNPDPTPSLNPQSALPSQNTKQLRYVIAALIGFVLLVGLLLLVSQRIGKKPALHQMPLSQTNVSPTVEILQNTTPVAQKIYTSSLFRASYPETWIVVSDTKENGITTVLLRPSNDKKTSLIIQGQNASSDAALAIVERLYTGIDYEKKLVRAGSFTSVLEGSAVSTDQKKLSSSQKRVALLYQDGKAFTVTYVYPGETPNAQREQEFMTFLSSFLPQK